jgi:elongator complex protein 3
MIKEQIIKQLIKDRVRTLKELDVIKRKMSKRYQISLFSNIELLKSYHNLVKNGIINKNLILENLLRKRKIRSLSGVVVVSVLTKSYPCPGKCIYCPSEKGLPKSYLSGEPAVERAKMENFDPYLQTKSRIESLEIQGHPTDKIELRIIGGSFNYYPKRYQSWFVKRCFDAANQRGSVNLQQTQITNETARRRIVGISIETRPDLINKKEILNFRKLGVTMVELGVQTIYNDILEKCQRGHLVEQTVQATQMLKNAGFKVLYQIMPNLPGSSIKRDFECVKTIFSNARFMPDWVKIYPCVVCKGTKLYQMWKQGKYKTYSDKDLINLLIKIKTALPYWVRVARLFRDIPSQKIESGSKFSNLRQIVQAEMKKREKVCHCVRCREVRENYNPKEKIFLFREDYNASNNREIFLSFENEKRTKLFSLLRLRILKNSAIIRELHTFGQMARISERPLSAQHKGLGKKLIKEAEKITKREFKLSKIAVISGVGAREYYRKLHYRLKDTYMVKFLK